MLQRPSMSHLSCGCPLTHLHTAAGSLATLSQFTNPDGSVSISFSLPPVWTGQDLGIKVVAQPTGSTAVLRPGQGVQSNLTSSTAFSYFPPYIYQLYTMRAYFNETLEMTVR
jgi:hypothetical protein